MTDDTTLTDSEVYALLNNVTERNVTHVTMPTGDSLWIQFRVHTDGRAIDLYTFEVNIVSGSLWLHKSIDGEKQTVWTNRCRR